MRIHVLQHVDYEGPGSIAAWARRNGHSVTCTLMSEQGEQAALGHVDWLIVMGGPMSVRDESFYPWMRHEKHVITHAIEGGVGILGICLGAQLIASALGARVHRNPSKEIGWFPVDLTPAGRESGPLCRLSGPLETFHWHEDTFDMPPGAVHLAASAGCRHQAFAYGEHILGLQFHPEMTREIASDLAGHTEADLTPGPYVQTRSQILGDDDRFEKNASVMMVILNHMEGSIIERREVSPGGP